MVKKSTDRLNIVSGCQIHELDIRGKQNLEDVSRKMVLNKSADLTKNSIDFKKYGKLHVY